MFIPVRLPNSYAAEKVGSEILDIAHFSMLSIWETPILALQTVWKLMYPISFKSIITDWDSHMQHRYGTLLIACNIV